MNRDRGTTARADDAVPDGVSVADDAGPASTSTTSHDAATDGAPAHGTAAPGAAAIAGRIQNALVGRAITETQLRTHVADGLTYGFDAVIVPGCWVPLARELIGAETVKQPGATRQVGKEQTGKELIGTAGSGPRLGLGGLLDFPYGSAGTASRVAAAIALRESGADQIDATVDIGLLLSGRQSAFAADLAAVVEAADGIPVKFMLELPLLDAAQRRQVVDAAVAAGAAYVKNASRGAVGIADAAQIGYLRRSVPDSVGVKASGGIRTIEQVRELLAAGADLIGTSSGVAIVTGQRATTGSVFSY